MSALPGTIRTDNKVDALCLGCSVILGMYSGRWGSVQLGEDLQFKVASSVAAAYLLLFVKVVMTSFETPLAKLSD